MNIRINKYFYFVLAGVIVLLFLVDSQAKMAYDIFALIGFFLCFSTFEAEMRYESEIRKAGKQEKSN